MSEQESRLLTAEQVQAIVGEHIGEPCPFGCRSHETSCKACEGVWPCPTKRLADHIAAQAEQIARQAVPTDSVTGEQMAELSHAEHEAREALIKASHAYYVSSGERLAQMILHGEDGRTKLAKQRRRKARTIVEAMDEAARNFVVALDRADAARTIRRHGVEVARRQA